MKTRYFILATLAMAGLAVSCAKSQIGGETPLPEEEAPVPIQLTTNLKVNSVSVTKAGVDAWAAEQKLYIYALPTNTITADESKILVKNAEASAPANGGTGDERYTPKDIYLYKTAEPLSFYYYPADKTTLDFYGYYVGDAFKDPALADNNPDKPAPVISENDKISLPLYLDGSQDIMLAKADKEEDVQKITDEIISPGNAYGAYSARKGVKPNLKFEHLLSRFVFYVVAGNAEGLNVEIKSVSLTSKSKANLIIAALQGDRGISPTDNVATPFNIKNDGGADFIPCFPKKNLEDETDPYTPGEDDRVGESIMVIPDSQNGHEMVITMQQKNDGHNVDLGGEFTITETLVPGKVTEASGNKATKFLPGYQYNVYIVVYGRQKVEVTVTLSKWNEGGFITIDRDKEMVEPMLGYKATGPDNKEYYLYFYSNPIVEETETTPGTEVKYWDKSAGVMAAPDSGTYMFDNNIGTTDSPILGVTLAKSGEGTDAKTTVTALVTEAPTE